MIHVQRGWDADEGEIAAKSRQAAAAVPIPAALRDHLLERRMSIDGDLPVRRPTSRRAQDDGARQPRRSRRPASASSAVHDCRHTYASLMIAAGVNAKALCDVHGARHRRRSRSTSTATCCRAPRTRPPGCSTRSWHAPPGARSARTTAAQTAAHPSHGYADPHTHGESNRSGTAKHRPNRHQTAAQLQRTRTRRERTSAAGGFNLAAAHPAERCR